MAYSVVPAEVSDSSDLATIFIDAFKNDAMLGKIWPDVPREIHQAYQTRDFTKNFSTLELDGGRYTKVVENKTGEIVGFAKWQQPYILTAEQTVQKTKAKKEREPPPEGTNLAFREKFFGDLAEKRSKWVDDSKDYILHLLCIAPTHQRRGLGSLLIEEGLAVADKHNAKTYVEASAAGLQLYIRHGWRPVDAIVIDADKYGSSGGIVSEQCLMRGPDGHQQQTHES